MKTPKVISKNNNQYILVKEYANFILYKDLLTGVKECFSKSKDKIVVLPKFIPWKQVLVDTNAEFVVFPSDRGGYNAQVVPKSRKDKEPRVNFPEEWAGKSKEELVALTGIKTLKFCHNSRFMVATDEFSDIIQACEMAKKF